MSAIIVEKDGYLATITINRPQVHNAFSPESLVRLADAWQSLAADPDVRVIIITGAGGKSFSVGADLGRLTPLMSGARPPEDEWDRRLLADPKIGDRSALRFPQPYPKPIIAAIEGFCYAGGLETMTGTDMRVASETATFALQEVKWSLIPAKGSIARLPRQIPYCKAMELMLTADRIDANEALRIGLVNYVVPAGGALAKARELALKVADNGPLAISAAKVAAQEALGRPLAEAYEIEDRAWAKVLASEDAREGPRAFMEKRKPVYRGK